MNTVIGVAGIVALAALAAYAAFQFGQTRKAGWLGVAFFTAIMADAGSLAVVMRMFQ